MSILTIKLSDISHPGVEYHNNYIEGIVRMQIDNLCEDKKQAADLRRKERADELMKRDDDERSCC